MKDEAKDFPTARFDGLKSKMYSCIKKYEPGYKMLNKLRKMLLKYDEAWRLNTFWKERNGTWKKMKKIQRKSHRFRSYEIDKKFLCHVLIIDALYLI